ncbi:tigger transposable element-derived protein 4-like [Uloborus diversus]|uniref:tigger transposable element-derived protein 4-like n=1 Tax=Uloborus diversus TaxID=327109 RepID=UPI002409CD3A|nr:tigger transposable element-derived protein 4-like [Uloborus diversus]
MQPMDQGIIKNLKVRYRKRVVLTILQCLEENSVPCITLLDSLRELRKAWSDVTQQTLVNCFKKAGFVKDASCLELDNEYQEDENMDDVNFQSEWGILQNKMNIPTDRDFMDFVSVDDGFLVTEYSTDEEILSKITEKSEKDSGDEEVEKE